ncbi:MAG: MOSC domain-containing protein [Acidimicrobiia bacterium]|nr:MOSC domain-containing protein [Acidimicrobiia bacterium]
MSSGTLTAIHLHPVKSCRRVEVEHSTVSPCGLEGDREWQVFSEDGKVLTQRRHPLLALVQPTIIDGGLRLSAPGHGAVEAGRPERVDREVRALLGDEVAVGDGGDEAARWLTALTGTPCRLVALVTSDARRIDLVPSQPVSLADATPVLVANEASRRDLQRRAVEPFGMERFRPNLVLDGPEAWSEDTWTAFSIGAARLEGLVPMPRCAMPQVDQDTAERRKEPALALRAHRWCSEAPSLPERWRSYFRGQGLFGLGATIEPAGAVIRVGDPLAVQATTTPLIPPPA